MVVPDFQSFMLPLLDFGADGKEHSQSEAVDALSHHFNISESDRKEMLPSGRPRFDNRVAWANVYLKGSLEGHRARKGVLITTSQFSPDALDYVTRIEKKIVLIDGKELAKLMIDYGLGVAVDAIYEIKRLDTDYFDEEL